MYVDTARIAELDEQITEITTQISNLWDEQDDACNMGNPLLANYLNSEIEDLVTRREILEKEYDKLYYALMVEENKKKKSFNII